MVVTWFSSPPALRLLLLFVHCSRLCERPASAGLQGACVHLKFLCICTCRYRFNTDTDMDTDVFVNVELHIIDHSSLIFR